MDECYSYRYNPPLKSLVGKTLYAARLVGEDTHNPDCVIRDESGVDYLVTSKWIIKALNSGFTIKDAAFVGSMGGMCYYPGRYAKRIKVPQVRIRIHQFDTSAKKAQVKLLFLTGLIIVVNDGWISSLSVKDSENVSKETVVSLRLSQYGTKLADQFLSVWLGNLHNTKLRLVLDDSIKQISSGAFKYILEPWTYNSGGITIDVSDMTDESSVYRVWKLLVGDIVSATSGLRWFSEVDSLIIDSPERKARFRKRALRRYVTLQSFCETFNIVVGVPVRFLIHVFQPVKEVLNVILDILAMLVMLVMAGYLNVATFVVKFVTRLCKLYGRIRGISTDDDNDDQDGGRGMKFIALH